MEEKIEEKSKEEKHDDRSQAVEAAAEAAEAEAAAEEEAIRPRKEGTLGEMKKEVTIEYIDREIATFSKFVNDRAEQIRHLEKEIEQVNCDRNAAWGALQQCIKIKTMIQPIQSNIIPLKAKGNDNGK